MTPPTEFETTDLLLVSAMLPLLLFSAFFSASETVLFGLSSTDRAALRARSRHADRAAASLLAEPRMLLITVLLGNMVANTLYFVLGSMLAMRLAGDVLSAALCGVGTVLGIVLLGEVLPKVLAASGRPRVAQVIAPVLFAVHRTVAPVRYAIDRVVISPLARLTAPAIAPRAMGEDELSAMLELSSREGVIDAQELELLHEVVRMRALRVADVMTPRVEMATIDRTATRADVLNQLTQPDVSELAVRGEDGDSIEAMLEVRDYLLDPRQDDTPIEAHLREVSYVPALATIEQLLAHFHATRTKLAIAIDEWGGTAGLVMIEDMAEELFGDFVEQGEASIAVPEQIATGSWRLSGGVNLHSGLMDDLADLFEVDGVRGFPTRVRTVGGLIFDQLGRVPLVGDRLQLGDVMIEVESMDGMRVTTARVDLLDDQKGGASDAR